MFWLKKLIAPFFFPLPVCVALLAAGLLLLWFTRRQRAGKICVTLGALLVIVLGFDLLPSAALRRLERQYPKIDAVLADAARQEEIKTSVKWVVVLGAGHVSDPQLPITSQASGTTLARVLEGVRVHRALPQTKLLLSGAQVFDSVAVAEIMKGVALSAGVSEGEIVLDLESKDTEEEARVIREVVKDDSFIMVTSAWHMPRAMALFAKHGMKPIPAPTDHLVKDGQGTTSPGDYFPSSAGFLKAERVCYEYLGLVWAKLKGAA